MDIRTRKRLEEAKDKSRPELKNFGWSTLCLADRFPLSLDCKDELDRIDGSIVSREEFMERYEKPYRPVVITNLLLDWAANQKWTLPRLAKKYRNQRFKVGEDDDGYSVKLKMKYFADYIRYQRDDSPLYLFDSSFGERHKVRKLLEDYSIPPYFQDDLFRYASDRRRPPHRWIVIGPVRSGTGIHIDPLGTSAWNALISGHKRWCMFAPGTPKELLKVKKTEGGKHQDEAATWFSVIYPRTQRRDWPSKYRCIEAIQKPGETMFIPGGWWHVVLNLSDTVAVTQNYCSTVNLPVVWYKTFHGRPKLARNWFKALKVYRPELVAVLNAVDTSTAPSGVQSSSSSSDSSSTDTSDSSSEDSEDSGQGSLNNRAAGAGKKKRKLDVLSSAASSPASSSASRPLNPSSGDQSCVSKIRRSVSPGKSSRRTSKNGCSQRLDSTPPSDGNAS